MNIVIIDDSELKTDDSIEALSKIYEDAKFYTFCCRNDALSFLQAHSDETNLIILDWNFPLLRGTMPEVGMGEDVLRWMKRKNISIDTVICSSEEVILEESYPNVIGSILYSPVVSCYSKYLEILNLKEHTAHVDAPSEDDYLLLREESFLTDSKYLEERIHKIPWTEEEKMGKEQRQKTKWKRKRSSDAWWKK